MIGSTWCGVGGPEREPDCLIRSLRYLAPMIYTADCMWSVGRRAPNALPYDPGERFLAAVAPESVPGVVRSSSGFLVDLAPYCTRSLRDKPDASGWLGYGPRQDLSTFPTGRVCLAGSEFLVSPGPLSAIMLWGTYAGEAKLPQEVKGIAIRKRAAGLLFLHVCGWPTDPGEMVAPIASTIQTAPRKKSRSCTARISPTRRIRCWPPWPAPPGRARCPTERPSRHLPMPGRIPTSNGRSARSISFRRVRASPTLLGLSVVNP